MLNSKINIIFGGTYVSIPDKNAKNVYKLQIQYTWKKMVIKNKLFFRKKS